MCPDPDQTQPCGNGRSNSSLSPQASSIVCYYATGGHTARFCSVQPERRTHTLTSVTVQLRVDNIDFAIFLGLFCRLGRPRAGDEVVGAPVLFQADQVEGNGAELPRPATLQKHHLVVVGDISVGTNSRGLEGHRPRTCTRNVRLRRRHSQQLSQQILRFVQDVVEIRRSVTHFCLTEAKEQTVAELDAQNNNKVGYSRQKCVQTHFVASDKTRTWSFTTQYSTLFRVAAVGNSGCIRASNSPRMLMPVSQYIRSSFWACSSTWKRSIKG